MTTVAPSGRQIELAAFGQRLTVVEVGGGIRSYTTAGGDPILDGYDRDEMCSGGRGQLLAPWPNRLADGSFEWDGQRLQTAITEVEAGNAIHGLVRWAAWTTEIAATDSATLAHRLHPQPGWPWTLDLAVTYTLSASGLEVRTSMANRSERACPVGFGWHPYLYAFGGRVDDCILAVPARTAYTSDHRGLPSGRGDVTGTELDFTEGRVIGSAQMDVCFTDLERDGRGRCTVRLDGPGPGSASLWVDQTYSHLMVFSGDTLGEVDRRRCGLAVEPMTGAPNLLRTGDGRRILEPGEDMEATWGLEIFS